VRRRAFIGVDTKGMVGYGIRFMHNMVLAG